MFKSEKIYDVVVCGAGPAGVAAACAAARTGVSVLLIERMSGPGGVAVQSGCCGIMGYCHDGRQIACGIADEVVRRLDKRGKVRCKHDRGRSIGDGPLMFDVVTTEYELALELNRMLNEAGVDRLYYCTPYEAVVEGRRIRQLKAICTGGNKVLINGRFFIDCTGDAALASIAGAGTVDADPESSMTKTVLFIVGPVKNFDGNAAKARFNEIKDKFPYKNQDALMMHTTGTDDELLINQTLIVGNPMDPADLTRMDIELREQVDIIFDWYKEHFPIFKDAHIIRVAPSIGIRNGRCIAGRETITCRDLDEGTPVAEPMALGRRGYGGHGGTKFVESWARSNPGERGVPYGALLSRDLDNLAAGGRCISIEHKASTALRFMSQCFCTGQAAGIAAALSVPHGHWAPYSEVRPELLRQGLLLE